MPHGVVNDSDNQRVSVFDKDGKFIETWAFPSRGGIVVTDGSIYVAGASRMTVMKITKPPATGGR